MERLSPGPLRPSCLALEGAAVRGLSPRRAGH